MASISRIPQFVIKASKAIVTASIRGWSTFKACTQDLSYSTVVLYRDHEGLGIFSGPKLSPQNQLDICFLALWEYWLGLAKPKNACLQINPRPFH